MVNGFRYYRALESVSIASALSTALTIYPRQIRVHQRWQSKLQLPKARKKEWRPATMDSYPRRLPVNTVIHTTLVDLEPATFRSLVRRATSSATEPNTTSRVTPKAYLTSYVFTPHLIMGQVFYGTAPWPAWSIHIDPFDPWPLTHCLFCHEGHQCALTADASSLWR